MPIEEEHSVETRLIGKEDLLLDEHGNGVEQSYEDANGGTHKLTPISSTTIPLPTSLRVSLGGSTNISEGMANLAQQISGIGGGSSGGSALTQNTTVVLSGTLTSAEKQTLIGQQLKNLGGYTLTIEFQEAYDVDTASYFEFKGFYNGTLIIDLNSVTVQDSADIAQDFYIHDCSCKVEVKDGTIKHLLSLYGIKAENCPCLYLTNIAFFGANGTTNFALRGYGINGVVTNCTYTDDNTSSLTDIGGASYNAYTDAKVSSKITEHNASNIAHSVAIGAHNTSNDAHSTLFAGKAPLSHSHTDSEAAAATSAVNAHNSANDAHASLFSSVTQSVSNVSGALTAGLCAGLVFPYMGSSAPAGYLLCDGSAISRTTYSSLFTAIGTTYGVGDGSTTFNIPDLRGKFIRGLGGDSAALGTAQAEGLPNITGTFGPVSSNDFTASGAFAKGSSTSGAGDGSSDFNVTIDASRSSAIYGASSHVTPVNMAVNFIIRY